MINTYNCDYRELFRNTADKAYDLAIVDVPYGISMDRGKIGSNKLAKATAYKKKDWDSCAPDKAYFEELKRVSVNQIIWGANHFIENIPDANSPCWIVWDKENSADFADCELAYASFGTAVRKFTFRWNGMLQGDMKNKQIRIHPTEKPVKLYEWLLRNYAKQGDRILDTHGGSFSHAIAAHNLGFDLDICEIDAEYYEKGVNRLKIYQSQVSMF